MTTETLEPANEIPLSFVGSTSGFFRVWAVNLALTIATLGVYSAWAKVRRRQYLYAHTRVGNVPFQYQARPLPILLGRLIALALLGAYVLASRLAPPVQPFAAVAIALGAPWLIVKSLRFRARYSTLGAVQFRFAGPLGPAYVYYLFAWLLVPFTLGLAYPAVSAWQQRWTLGEHRVGGRRLRMRAPTAAFYGAWGVAVVVFVGGGVLGGALGWGLGGSGALALIGLYGGGLLAAAHLNAETWNLVYGSLELEGGSRLLGSLRGIEILGLWTSNALALLATLGLAYPWVVVRMARYRAAHLVLESPGELADFQMELQPEEGSGGAETAEIFDLDFGL